MARKRAAPVPNLGNAEPQIPDLGTITSEPPIELPYIEGLWSGLPQWRCRLCPWDTLEGEDVMWEHIAARHGAAEPVAPRLVQAYDARGNPIE